MKLIYVVAPILYITVAIAYKRQLLLHTMYALTVYCKGCDRLTSAVYNYLLYSV